MEDFKADVLVFFVTSWTYAAVKVTTSGQICEMSVYISILQYVLQYGSAVLQCILQYAFYHIVSPLVYQGSPQKFLKA